MTALIVLLAAVVAVQTVLIVGLLRSHAAILRRLHDLGAGIADVVPDTAVRTAPGITGGATAPAGRPGADIAGVSVTGDDLRIPVVGGDGPVLLVFLSSTCLTCARFWEDLKRPARLAVPDRARLVIVTKGPESESPGSIAKLAPRAVPTVLSSAAWADYAVPGAPYVVAVDGPTGRVIGEGTGNSWSQVSALLSRAADDASSARSQPGT